MGAVGFEPTKAEPSDLQSDPFVHFGTRPRGVVGWGFEVRFSTVAAARAGIVSNARCEFNGLTSSSPHAGTRGSCRSYRDTTSSMNVPGFIDGRDVVVVGVSNSAVGR